MPGMKRDCGGAAGILGAFQAAVKLVSDVRERIRYLTGDECNVLYICMALLGITLQTSSQLTIPGTVHSSKIFVWLCSSVAAMVIHLTFSDKGFVGFVSVPFFCYLRAQASRVK